VEKICIWTPDKDLAQCISGDLIVQIDRRAGEIRDEEAVRKKFGVGPSLIPDYLALVGDSADGYPGIGGIGKIGAVRLLNEYGPIEKFPKTILGKQHKQALLFKKLATLRTDKKLFKKVSQLQWHGPDPAFSKFTKKANASRLLERANKLAEKVKSL
jgi:5'-3' exonuclease